MKLRGGITDMNDICSCHQAFLNQILGELTMAESPKMQRGIKAR